MAQKLHEIKAVAARYATALFDLAVQQNKQDVVGADLMRLARAIEGHEEWTRMVANPQIPVAQKTQAYEALLVELKADAMTVAQVTFIVRQQRAAILPTLAELFEQKRLAHKQELKAEVITALPLSAAYEKRVADALRAAAGTVVHVDFSSDADLIGGIVIKMGSRMLDRSVAGKLDRLQTYLQTAAAAEPLSA